MPFKHNAARRHGITRARYRVRNWRACEAGLGRRGDLTLWLDEAALSGWRAPRRSTPGGQPVYTDLAIEAVLSLRLVFHLALRQAAGLAGSVLRLLGLDLPVPDHTTLSRRGRAFAGRQPRVRAGTSPLHLVLDSTGLELFGQGEWDAAKHGRRTRRWTKLHLAVDATTGEIAAHVLTEGTADPAQHTARDRHIQLMAEKGRMGWQRRTGYGRRSLAETAVGRYKHLIGPKLRARSLPGQQGEAALAVPVLNRMTRTAKPVSVRVA